MQVCVNLEFLNGLVVDRVQEKEQDSFRSDKESS
jgi:hypothetical protein